MSIQWELVFFLLLVGIGSGTFVASVITTEWFGKAKQIRTTSMIVSLVLLALGGFTSVLHLSHPGRIFGAFSHPTSGIFMEALLIGLVGLDIIVFLLALRRKATDSSLKIIGTIGVVLAVILAFSVGNSYTMPSKPAWDTIILPLNYLASAGVMGLVCLSALVARSKEHDPKLASGLNLATLITLVVQAALVIAYLVYLAAAPYPDVTRSVSRVLGGDLAWLFWGGIVLLGLIIPTILIARMKQKKADIGSMLKQFGVSLACVLLGGVALRVMMFALGSGILQYF